jgi:outer membrane protein OmpA-like peptidoglycan-associated protein
MMGCGSTGVILDEVFESIDEIQARVDDVSTLVDSVQAVVEPLAGQVQGLGTGLTDVRMAQESKPTPALPAVYFEFDSYVLSKDVKQQLLIHAGKIKDNVRWRVRLVGHADVIGEGDYNLELSFNRAMTVMDFLIAHGVDRSRIGATGHGESTPVSELHELNRRVEFEVL